MAKKKKGSKLPKTIAGVKVPKALRQIGSVSALLDTPLGRQVLADALVAAAGAAAAALVRHPPGVEAVKHAGNTAAEAADSTKDAVQSTAGSVTGAVAEVARHVLPSSLSGEPPAEPRDAYAHLADERQEGKKSRPRDKESKH